MKKYFDEIERKVKVEYSIATEARLKGLDPIDMVEISLATSLAERVTGLVSVKYPQTKDNRIVKRIRELEEKYSPLDPAVALSISEEVAKEKFCKFKNLEEAIEAGIRIGFAYITLGVVSSPIEGFTYLKLGKTRKGGDYFMPYFSGPIRSAGTTASCVALLIIDHLREVFGFARYDPTENEIKRTSTELYDFHERISNLQYLPTVEEIEFLAKHIPIQVAGEPSEIREVSNYKDLSRVDTNFIRSGFCLILGEGLAQKAPKALKIMRKLREKGFKLSAWDFLEEYVKLHQKRQEGKTKESPAYIQDLVAGRPVLGHPSRSGSFRLRYGRSRYSGYSALAIHPATMIVLSDSIAVGTQLKTELPTKGAAITPCDSIDGPIVKLKDGSVVKLNDVEKARNVYKNITEIIYLGDILIPYGDFSNRNHVLMPCGYNEEYWLAQLRKNNPEIKNTEFKNIQTLAKAKEISKKFNVPLHPRFIFFWSQISKEDFKELIEWLLKAKIEDKIILPFSQSKKQEFEKAKRALELLGVEHTPSTEDIIINEDAEALLLNLSIEDKKDADQKLREIINDVKDGSQNVLEFINKICSFEIKDKAGTFIGARMGRPEKAKLRKLTGSPHMIFPVGEAGGRLRSAQEASKSSVKADFPIFYCDNCKKETIVYICENCGNKTRQLYYCPKCERTISESCPEHGGLENGIIKKFRNKRVDIKHYIDCAISNLSIQKEELPVLIKGVRGTSSADHACENIAKGILRAQFNLNVNKDGTMRYDATELPVTHFKPKEIRTSIETLKQIGYSKDIFNKPLENDEQILEIKPHDVILPDSEKSPDEKAGDVFLKESKFIDNLLVRFYGLRPFFEAKSKEDLVGHLILCIAPHNCAGVVGRIIGFSQIQAFLASPYMHAAMRRDCDGDEAAFTLLLDCLLNFSKKYLPAHRGGTQDSPLVLNARIRANEVDDMVFDIDVVKELPLELYEAAEKYTPPHKIRIDQISDRLGTNSEFTNLYYTHEVSNINNATLCSSYKTLATMEKKVSSQMEIAEKIRAVDERDVARLVINRHFIRDIKGNLRQFTTQQFRCVGCNAKYRRPPLKGVCLKCNGKIIFTVYEKTITKYLEPALKLAKKYDVPNYVKQAIELVKQYIESIFGKELEKQEALQKWI